MQAIDRWKRELDQSLDRLDRSLAGAQASARLGAAIREHFALSFRALPRDLLDALLEGVEAWFAADREGAKARCATLGSILLMDYDGGALEESDWDGLREAFSDAGGDVDLDLLTYVMQLVLDKGRI
ncbi:MAG TPA: hypothetical protein VMV83_09990 [Rectinemataceae bacterium]|nr:hypothetical protein [Rectinemataceae bacterium]